MCRNIDAPNYPCGETRKAQDPICFHGCTREYISLVERRISTYGLDTLDVLNAGCRGGTYKERTPHTKNEPHVSREKLLETSLECFLQ